MEQNIKLWVSDSAQTPLEFELTRDPHMRPAPGRPYTVSACFRDPPRHLHGDAWRILLHAVKGRGLLPAHVRGYAKCQLDKWGSTPLGEDEDEASLGRAARPRCAEVLAEARAGSGQSSRRGR